VVGSSKINKLPRGIGIVPIGNWLEANATTFSVSRK
jgi:hypothetical protein